MQRFSWRPVQGYTNLWRFLQALVLLRLADVVPFDDVILLADPAPYDRLESCPADVHSDDVSVQVLNEVRIAQKLLVVRPVSEGANTRVICSREACQIIWVLIGSEGLRWAAEDPHPNLSNLVSRRQSTDRRRCLKVLEQYRSGYVVFWTCWSLMKITWRRKSSSWGPIPKDSIPDEFFLKQRA